MYNERIPQTIDDWSYLELLKNLKSAAHGMASKVIGYQIIENLDAEFPIYSFEYNKGKKKKIFILSGVHGEEIAGPLSLLHIMRAKHEYLDPEVHYVIVPVLNPYAYDLKQRFDDDNEDINCIYKSVLDNKHYEEKDAILKYYHKKKFDLFISMHEDMDMDKFYLYGYGAENLEKYREILQIAKDHKVKLLDTEEVYDVKLDEHGLVMNYYDDSIDHYLYSTGMAKVSFTNETPMKLDLEKRIEISKAIVKHLTKLI